MEPLTPNPFSGVQVPYNVLQLVSWSVAITSRGLEKNYLKSGSLLRDEVKSFYQL